MTVTTQPELWLLVGGNGAGKTTFYERFLAPRKIPLVNADNIARSVWPDAPEKHSYEAALIAERERFRLLEEARIPRTLANLRQCIGLVDELHLVDNSSLDHPYVRIAVWQDGQWRSFVETLPGWASDLIDA